MFKLDGWKADYPAGVFPPSAIGYDIETFPNCFLFTYAFLTTPDTFVTFEISFRRNDATQFIAFLEWCRVNGIEMIGYNNLHFDYTVIDWIYRNPHLCDAANIYARAQQIFASQERFGQEIWERDRLAPQLDLMKVHHFDNKAKVQSLKGLEFNMRSELVQEMPVPIGSFLTGEQIDQIVIPYNRHDVRETIKFAYFSAGEIKLRRDMKSQLTGDVMNFNSTKIGKQILEQRLGEERCYTRGPSGRREKRQTIRDVIRLREVVFPYIHFDHPEFRRIHQWMLAQEISETKGVFKDVSATVNGMTFHYGTGGIHGSVSSRVFYSDTDYVIEDVDVASQYPNIAIVNNLYPHHLGPEFVPIYAGVIDERKKHPKGTSANAALKLAGNGSYGASNDKFSTLYDPQFTMAITINGQLMISMLAEWLMTVPTLKIIQANTDGITYYIARQHCDQARRVCVAWECYTKLKLEYARYGRMFIRDVNNYIAENEDRKKVKLKGAYKYYESADEVSNDSPPAWHKDLGAPIVQMAAVKAMLDGVEPEAFIGAHPDPYDFLLRAKVDRRSTLYIGDDVAGNIIRYFIALNGKPLRKVSPPTGAPGTYKKKTGISDQYFAEILATLPPMTWDERIHTKNRSTYEEREIGFVAGWNAALANHIRDFDWTNLNRQWYVDEAKKLIIR